MSSESQITPGELIGHRIWNVSQLKLRSVYTYHEWPVGIMSSPRAPYSIEDLVVAETKYYKGWHEGLNKVLLFKEFEDFESALGIHAFKTRAQAAAYVRGYERYCVVLGTIDMWGVVWEHERGYRAQHARVKSLEILNDPLGDIDINALRARYDVVQPK